MADSYLPERLSGKYKSSYAYATIKDRLPVIVTRVVDTLYQSKHEVKDKYGEEGSSELKQMVHRMSKLRNEVQTNKPVIRLEDNRTDTHIWNTYLEEETEKNGGTPPSWFCSSWLYVECYMYRRIQEAVELSKKLHELDPFQKQKQNAFTSSEDAVKSLLNHVRKTIDGFKNGPNFGDVYPVFHQFIQIALWGNKCDLSITAGRDNPQKACCTDMLTHLEQNILVDDTRQLWTVLQTVKSAQKQPVRLDIILDNSGFELMTDFCLAEILLSSGIVSIVHFHAKPMPWFISDVTPCDFRWTLNHLEKSNDHSMAYFGKLWNQRLENQTWNFHIHDFWSLPFDFSLLRHYASDLYDFLAGSNLILFKGDLNYRKLVADRSWDSVTPFEKALQGFHPAPLCTMRTLKADVIVGLRPGLSKETEMKDKDWQINGNWAIISFCGKVTS